MAVLEQVSFIGCGKVGQALARALKNAGYGLGAIVCSRAENAKKAVAFIGAGQPGTDPTAAIESGFIHFIATKDDAIEEVARQIASAATSLEKHYFFHTSGALGSTVLEELRKKGAEVGSIHPLQVFADPSKAVETLPGIYYAIEGTDRAMALAVQLVDRLQGKLLLIPTGRKMLYHVAGVFAANYLTVIIEYALSIMDDLGESPEEAYQAFLPLMVGALENIEEFGTAGALTGPIARGDVETVRAHVEQLKGFRTDLVEAYKVLGREAVRIAVRGGLSSQKAKNILEILG